LSILDQLLNINFKRGKEAMKKLIEISSTHSDKIYLTGIVLFLSILSAIPLLFTPFNGLMLKAIFPH